MKPKTDPPLNVFVYNDFVKRFHQESDRAAAVLAGGYLDALLEAALRSMLASGRRVDDLFDGQGPLRSFSSKISIAYALGLVTDALARDMDLIRKIRNHFAHHIWEATFETPPVSDWCAQIAVVDSFVDYVTRERVKDTNPPRLRYLLAVGVSILQIAHSPKVSPEFRAATTGIRDIDG